MQGMNSHPDRSLGNIPTSQERPRLQLKVSLCEPYCSFSHCSQQFRSHLMQGRRRRRNLQTDPSKPLPKLTHQPCPREGWLHSDPSSTQISRFSGHWQLFLQQQKLAVKE